MASEGDAKQEDVQLIEKGAGEPADPEDPKPTAAGGDGPTLISKAVCEFIGTLTLVLFGVGSAVLPGSPMSQVGSASNNAVSLGYYSLTAIPFAFGIAIIAMAYGVGPVSGCHVNPAVSLACAICKRMCPKTMLVYWAAQFVGGIAGAAIVAGIASGQHSYQVEVNGLGANGWGPGYEQEYEIGAAFFAELVFTFIFVVVILGSTSKEGCTVNAGIAIGLTLTAIHIIAIPITGVSVNPARSFGPAIFVGGERLKQVWLFFVAPFLGAALAGALFYPGLNLLEVPPKAKAE